MNQNNPQASGLHRYVDAMLKYWDPWNLIHGSMAPDDEYKSYIDCVVQIAQIIPFDSVAFTDELYVIFEVKGMPTSNLKRAIEGMVEGIKFYHSLNK